MQRGEGKIFLLSKAHEEAAMNIATMMGTSNANALEAVYGENSKKHREDPLAVPSWSEDTISISDAARALAALAKDEDSEEGLDSGDEQKAERNDVFTGYAKLAAKRATMRSSAASETPSNAALLNETTEEVQNSGEKPANSATSTDAAPANSSSGMRPSAGETVAKLQSKLKELQQKLVDAQNSNLPDQTKGAMISSISSQIGQVVQEINELAQQVQA